MTRINSAATGELRLAWLRHVSSLSQPQAFDELKSSPSGLAAE